MEFINALWNNIEPLILTFITALFTFIATKMKTVYENYVKNETARKIVTDTVKYVEQVYKDLHGKDKLEKAENMVAQVLESKGIDITKAEIDILIESAVYGLNKGWFESNNSSNSQTESQVIK